MKVLKQKQVLFIAVCLLLVAPLAAQPSPTPLDIDPKSIHGLIFNCLQALVEVTYNTGRKVEKEGFNIFNNDYHHILLSLTSLSSCRVLQYVKYTDMACIDATIKPLTELLEELSRFQFYSFGIALKGIWLTKSSLGILYNFFDNCVDKEKFSSDNGLPEPYNLHETLLIRQ